MTTEPGHGLCFRCEHRATFLESGIKPRFECGEARSVHGCYMFMPCKPIVVGPIEGEKRPIFAGWMFAGRIQSYGLVDDERIQLNLVDVGEKKMSAVWKIKSVPDPHLSLDPALIRGLNKGTAELRRTIAQAKEMGLRMKKEKG